MIILSVLDYKEIILYIAHDRYFSTARATKNWLSKLVGYFSNQTQLIEKCLHAPFFSGHLHDWRIIDSS